MDNGARASARREPLAARLASRSNRLPASKIFCLHHRHVWQALPLVSGFASNPALLLVLGRTLEPCLTTAALLLRPGFDFLCGGSQLRFWKPAETPALEARPLTLFLLARSGEPSLTALMFALRPLRHVVSGRTEARLGKAQRRTSPVPPHPVLQLVLGWTGEPRLATFPLTGPRLDSFGRRRKRLISGIPRI